MVAHPGFQFGDSWPTERREGVLMRVPKCPDCNCEQDQIYRKGLMSRYQCQVCRKAHDYDTASGRQLVDGHPVERVEPELPHVETSELHLRSTDPLDLDAVESVVQPSETANVTGSGSLEDIPIEPVVRKKRSRRRQAAVSPSVDT